MICVRTAKVSLPYSHIETQVPARSFMICSQAKCTSCIYDYYAGVIHELIALVHWKFIKQENISGILHAAQRSQLSEQCCPEFGLKLKFLTTLVA